MRLGLGMGILQGYQRPQSVGSGSAIVIPAFSASGVGTAFDYTSLSGLVLDIDSDFNTTGSTDGAAVGTWAMFNGSASSLTQATAANKPTLHTNVLNGHGRVTFDAVNDTITSASTLAAVVSADKKNFTWFWVGRIHTFVGANANFYQNAGCFGDNFGGAGITTRAAGSLLECSILAGTVKAVTFTPAVDTDFILEFKLVAGTLKARIGSGAYTTLANSTAIGSVAGQMAIGRLNAAVFLDGSVSKVLAWNLALADSDSDKVMSALKAKYAL